MDIEKLTRFSPYAVEGGYHAHGEMDEDEFGNFLNREDAVAVFATLTAERDRLLAANRELVAKVTFRGETPETTDCVLCLYCAGFLHAPEHDVFWEETTTHYCAEQQISDLSARVAELEAQRDALAGLLADAYGAGLDWDEILKHRADHEAVARVETAEQRAAELEAGSKRERKWND